MSTLISYLWGYFFAWMPIGLQIVFGAFLVLAAIVIVFKVVALVLDAIPFL